MKQLEGQGIEEYYLEPAVFLNGKDACIGVAEAHKGIIRRNYDKEQITIFEDDIVFTHPESWKAYWKWAEELPENWLIYSGGQYRTASGSKYKQPHSQNLNIARWTFGGAHWYTIRKGCYDSLLNCKEGDHFDVHMGQTGIQIFVPKLLPSRQIEKEFEGKAAWSERKNNYANYPSLRKRHKYYTE